MTKTTLTAALAQPPWCADLKLLCWKAGQSFMKQHNHPECFYGHIYEERKALENARNDQGLFAEQAAKVLEEKNIGKETPTYKAYKGGKLPPAHIDQRAQRYAVKMFLSHLHHVMYETHFRTPPPRPYAMAILGHTDYVPPPNWPPKPQPPN